MSKIYKFYHDLDMQHRVQWALQNGVDVNMLVVPKKTRKRKRAFNRMYKAAQRGK